MVLLLLQLQQHLCCAPLTRVMLRSSSRTICSLPTRPTSTTTAVSVPSSSKMLTHVDPHVLLGMSEQDLQQLAIHFGQQSYRGKQLHHLLYKTKAKEIQDFSHLPQAFRNDLQEAGYKVGRSPIHQVVTAADGTIKGLPSDGAIERADSYKHMSVIVVLKSVELLVDLMWFPGQLILCSTRAIFMSHIAAAGESDSAENDSCDSPLEPNSPLYGCADRADAECLEQDEAIQPLHQRRLEASSNVAGPSLRNVMLRPTTSLD